MKKKTSKKNDEPKQPSDYRLSGKKKTIIISYENDGSTIIVIDGQIVWSGNIDV